MSQTIHGDRNTQISVTESDNVVININGQQVIELEVRAYPKPLPDPWNKIDLLKAAHAQIPFLGREEILRDFMQWCEAPPAVSFRTLVGQGGAGKTRFAYELYARIKALPDWSAYFLHFHENSAKGVDLWSEIKSKNALLIADYASDSARPLADLLRPLTNPAPDGRRIRVLLLARTASWDQGWLASLTSGRTGGEVDRCFRPREPIQISQLSPEQRHAIFQKMVEIVAQRTSKAIPLLPPPERFADKEVAERLADPLTLMMAALITFESGGDSALYLNRTELAHEVAETLVAERIKGAVEDHGDLFLHMAAYATLCGGLEEPQALRALDQEAAETKLGQVADPKAFLDKLQAWLPGTRTKTWIGTIEPDIVGEAYVLGRGKKANLRDPKATLFRAVAQRARPTLNSVIRMVLDFSYTDKEPRLEPLSWLNELIERGQADKNLSLLIDVSAALPQTSSTGGSDLLRTALCAQLQVLAESHQYPDLPDIQSRFTRLINNLANMQSETGQHYAN